MRCVMTQPQTNKHCNVRALSHKVKCGCSVRRIRTNINNLTASKHATIRVRLSASFEKQVLVFF